MGIRVWSEMVEPGDLRGSVQRELRLRLQADVASLASRLEEHAKVILAQELRNSPEYDSLISGALREEFGLEDARSMVESVVVATATAVRVEVGAVSGDQVAALQLVLMREGFIDSLAAHGAKYVSVSKTGKASAVPWLEWLLFAGTTRVTIAELLLDYPSRKVISRRGSRTGRAIMVSREFSKAKPAGRYNARLGRSSKGYSVNPLFAGTSDSNWLTRVGQKVMVYLEAWVSRYIERMGR